MDYWLDEFVDLADKTRSIIINSMTGLCQAFMKGKMREMFCTDTNITPEDSFAGKIIVLDLPILEYNLFGKYAQVLYKYCWQKAVESRKIDADTKPVFLWADEAQYFITGNDQSFLTTARSARVSTVFLTQNLPNYLAAMGGNHAKDKVNSLLANLSTKVFHCNGCHETNQWAANTIERTISMRQNFNFNDKEKGGSGGGFSEGYLHQVPSVEFTRLKTGGALNDCEVEAYVFKTGRTFQASGANFIKTCFTQV